MSSSNVKTKKPTVTFYFQPCACYARQPQHKSSKARNTNPITITTVMPVMNINTMCCWKPNTTGTAWETEQNPRLGEL